MRYLNSLLFVILSFLFLTDASGQQTVDLTKVEPGKFDYGRMWTFENAPLEYFKDTYGIDMDESWLDQARKAALRFSTFCTASFVSPKGLIMTNHHCARGVVDAVKQEGEDFDKNGFYAKTIKDERQVPGLFVDQLVMIADITDFVKTEADAAENDAQRGQKIQAALEQAKNDYSAKEGWEGLNIQTVTYYSGGKYSLYGYKRYNDIRVVFVPELDLGYYGGDPDNFTYPRYNLDCSFFRAYDEEGNPVNTSTHYYKFNPDGVKENEPVFVVGNPGSTERYRTIAQLEYDRDRRFPMQLATLETKMDLAKKKYEQEPNDQLKDQIFSYSNSQKAFTGILEGLNDPYLFARKVVMEKRIKDNFKKIDPDAPDYWMQLGNNYEQIADIVAELIFLNPFNYGEATFAMLQQLQNYKNSMEQGADESELESLRSSIMETAGMLNTEMEKDYLGDWLAMIKEFSTAESNYIDEILEGRDPHVAAEEIINNTVFVDKPKKAEKKLEKKTEKFFESDDPLIEMMDLMMPEYQKAIVVYQQNNPTNKALEEKIANAFFQVYGDDTPPDATFTLRISDGVVKGYGYNGTIAPYKTTYFGLYDRHYSNDGEFPWDLPKRWMDPPMELLKSPLNFVSTNDIIGGNSGSAIINKNREAVGLIFDGNIESLPGNFIFDQEVNRSVSVHAGGITAALKHIYKAKRLLNELL